MEPSQLGIKVGEPVSRDEVICDIETDKVVFEVVAPADGSWLQSLKVKAIQFFLTKLLLNSKLVLAQRLLLLRQ